MYMRLKKGHIITHTKNHKLNDSTCFKAYYAFLWFLSVLWRPNFGIHVWQRIHILLISWLQRRLLLVSRLPLKIYDANWKRALTFYVKLFFLSSRSDWIGNRKRVYITRLVPHSNSRLNLFDVECGMFYLLRTQWRNLWRCNIYRVAYTLQIRIHIFLSNIYNKKVIDYHNSMTYEVYKCRRWWINCDHPYQKCRSVIICEKNVVKAHTKLL